MKIENMRMSDFGTPHYSNDPQDEVDSPCESVDEEEITATFCNECGQDCDQRVKESCLVCVNRSESCELSGDIDKETQYDTCSEWEE